MQLDVVKDLNSRLNAENHVLFEVPPWWLGMRRSDPASMNTGAVNRCARSLTDHMRYAEPTLQESKVQETPRHFRRLSRSSRTRRSSRVNVFMGGGRRCASHIANSNNPADPATRMTEAVISADSKSGLHMSVSPIHESTRDVPRLRLRMRTNSMILPIVA